jgi:hypothetical protein
MEEVEDMVAPWRINEIFSMPVYAPDGTIADCVRIAGPSAELNGIPAPFTYDPHALHDVGFGGPGSGRYPKGSGAKSEPAEPREEITRQRIQSAAEQREILEEAGVAPVKMVTMAQLRQVQAQALEKCKNATPPTQAERIKNQQGIRSMGADHFVANVLRPNSRDRARLRQRLAREFGDGKTCPCVHCGKVLSLDQISLDKIYTTAEGGTYRFGNTLGACLKCNMARGETPWTQLPFAGTPAILLPPRRSLIH